MTNYKKIKINDLIKNKIKKCILRHCKDSKACCVLKPKLSGVPFRCKLLSIPPMFSASTLRGCC
jgi:hypothetical protein